MHHIWQKDHLATDPTTGAACDANDTTNQNCIAPLNQRVPKPIVYYTSDSWPAYNDVRHSKMWLHAALLANDYDDDMRGVVAAALRGGPNSVEKWAAAQATPIPMATGVEGINYSIAPPDYANRYKGAKGLDYLAYPPDIRRPRLGQLRHGRRAAQRHLADLDNSTLCTASQITAGQCHMCDPTTSTAWASASVPLTAIPRMYVMCHNPVSPGSRPARRSTRAIPPSRRRSTFLRPAIRTSAIPRPDSDRTATPLNPQMGDLRYHMLAWVSEPDQASPGGIGEPAFDPVTGEIVTSHGYIYGRAIELNATASADLVAVMNGWETYNDIISGAQVARLRLTPRCPSRRRSSAPTAWSRC